MAFREDPEDASRSAGATDRSDEIGVAEREFAEMQAGLRAALHQKTRLAALGTAVTKINHDLRNILATAGLVSDRLAGSDDPDVKRIAPTLVKAIDRAVHLCSNTLNFTREGPPVRLAVSLTAATDELRTRLIPLNRRYPIASLVEAGSLYEERTGSRVTYEYVLLAGVNDSREDARRLGRLLRGRRVNLIPFNPVSDTSFERPAIERQERFKEILEKARIATTIRYSKGRKVDAACGQLRRRS